jgi:hypothetical protein
MHLLLLRIIPMVVLWVLIGAPFALGLAAEKAGPEAGKRHPPAGATGRALDEKLVVQEDALDQLTAAGEASSESCDPCPSPDPSIQERIAAPVPGTPGSAMSFMIQEEARAAGARIPAPINANQHINLFPSTR